MIYGSEKQAFCGWRDDSVKCLPQKHKDLTFIWFKGGSPHLTENLVKSCPEFMSAMALLCPEDGISLCTFTYTDTYTCVCTHMHAHAHMHAHMHTQAHITPHTTPKLPTHKYSLFFHWFAQHSSVSRRRGPLLIQLIPPPLPGWYLLVQGRSGTVYLNVV